MVGGKIMGFKWYSIPIDWKAVTDSLDLFFENIKAPTQCGIVWGDQEELFVFEYNDMKFPNEDNWEELL